MLSQLQQQKIVQWWPGRGQKKDKDGQRGIIQKAIESL